MMIASRTAAWLTLYARLALGVSFLAAVTDRLGVWGPHGTANVAWGDMRRFQTYTGLLNPWFPESVLPGLSWLVTVAEVILGVALIVGVQLRWLRCSVGPCCWRSRLG